MSVYRPKDRPHFVYEFWLHGRRFRGTTEKTTKRAAEAVEKAKRAEAERDIQAGSQPERKRMTLDIAAGRYWLEVAQHQPSANATDFFIANLSRLIGKDRYLDEITDDVVADYVARRRGERDKRYRKDAPLVAPGSVNRDTETLRRIIYRARDLWGVETPKVAWPKHKLKEPPGRIRVLGHDEERRLLAALAPYLRDPVRFMLWTGVRAGNALRLDWSQVDMRRRVITLLVKGGKHHVLPMTEPVFLLLARQKPRAEGRVFRRDGEPFVSWQRAWYSALERAGIKDFRMHDLRHTAASRMVEAGINLAVVQKVLAHADITTTRRYVHFEQTAMSDALDALVTREIPSFDDADDASD